MSLHEYQIEGLEERISDLGAELAEAREDNKRLRALIKEVECSSEYGCPWCTPAVGIGKHVQCPAFKDTDSAPDDFYVDYYGKGTVR